MKNKLLFCIVILSLALSGCSADKQVEEKTIADTFMDASDGVFTFDEPGIYGPSEGVKIFDGDLLINSEDVTLRNLSVLGNITISSKVGNGDASLESVSAEGTLMVNGGGENSVKIKSSSLPFIEINRPDGRVRIFADNDTSIVAILIISSANIDTSRVDDILISPEVGGTEIMIHGSVGEITVTGEAKIMLDERAEVEEMQIDPNARGTEVAGEGTILSARIDADDVRMDTNMDDYYSTTFPKAFYVNGIPEEPEHRNYNDHENSDDQMMTKENWEVGLPWDAEWGEMPDGAWTPESGIPWKPEWGVEPNDDDFDSDNPDAGDSNDFDDPNGDNVMTKENWEVGLPWDAEWGETPDGAWTPESGIPWKPEWGEEPNDDDFDSDNPDAEQTSETTFEFLECSYSLSGNSVRMEISLSRPATVYYVFEDISVMMGDGYLPSESQIIAGQNATGGPNGKTLPNMDEDINIGAEALIRGSISVTEAGENYSENASPSSSPEDDAPEDGQIANLHGSFLAVDANGNRILKQ
ncbi:MAG TPA: hypothetical protein VJ990_01975 [Clostridia bacterium]|nr:hypothetical protein [Clostridia bacterium]